MGNTTKRSAAPLMALVLLAAGCQSGPSQAGPTLPELESYAHKLDDPERDAWQKPGEVVALLDCSPGHTAVDLGAGTGYFIGHLSRAVGSNGRVLALDTAESTVDFLQARIEREDLRNVEPIVVPPDDPSLAPHSVNRVLVVNTWHHIENRVEYAQKLKLALRPGGKVLIVDFTNESPVGPPVALRLTSDTVSDELRAAGFDVELLDETLPHQYAVAGTVP